MLSADVVVAELAGLLQGELKHAFGAWCEGDFDGNEPRPTADDFFNLNSGVLEVHTHGFENLGGNAGAFTDQAEQDLLSTHEIVAEAAGLFLGQHDHLDGLFSKPLKHRSGRQLVNPSYQE